MVRTMRCKEKEGRSYTKFNLICIKTLPIKSEYTHCFSRKRHSAARKDQHNFPSSFSPSLSSFYWIFFASSNIDEKKCNLRCFMYITLKGRYEKFSNDSKMSWKLNFVHFDERETVKCDTWEMFNSAFRACASVYLASKHQKCPFANMILSSPSMLCDVMMMMTSNNKFIAN